MSVDRLLAPFEALVKRFTSRLDYCALYACKVVAQNADGTLELQPDDARMPQVSGVPIRHGIPGISVTVAGGSRVLLGFENASPARPFAALWDASSVTEIKFNGGTKAVARVDDTVEVTFSVDDVAAMVMSNAGGPVVAVHPVTLSGKITSGVAAVKA
jgi:hypothetical protein